MICNNAHTHMYVYIYIYILYTIRSLFVYPSKWITMLWRVPAMAIQENPIAALSRFLQQESAADDSWWAPVMAICS